MKNKIVLIILIAASVAMGATITSKVITGAWETGTNWVGDVAPVDGVDVGDEVELYRAIKFHPTPSLHVIQHSNTITNLCLMQMFSEQESTTIEQIKLLGKIGKRIIN